MIKVTDNGINTITLYATCYELTIFVPFCNYCMHKNCVLGQLVLKLDSSRFCSFYWELNACNILGVLIHSKYLDFTAD